jgi:Uma2 family endonuclease
MLVTHSVKRYTYTDYRNLDVDDNYLYELINGELVQKSAPSPRHQMISGNLYIAMKSYASANKSETVLYAPVDVFVDEYSVPQPDLLFVKNEHKEYITPDGVFGPPVYQLTGNEYELHSFAVEKGAVQSKVLEGFAVNIDDIFTQ